MGTITVYTSGETVTVIDTSVPPENPPVTGQSMGTANVCGLVYGRSPSYTSDEYTQIAQRFGMIVGTPTEIDGPAMRAVNPSLIMLEYINTTNVTEGDGLWQFIQAEPNPNSLIRQAVTETVQEIDGTSYTLAPGAFVHSYRQNNRWQTDYTNDANRSRLAAFVAQRATAQPSEWSGFFIDNDDIGGGYAGSIQSGEVEGGTIGPAPLSHGPIMEANLNALKSAMDIAVPSNKYMCHNVSNYGVTMYGGQWWWNITSASLPNGTPLSRTMVTAFMLSRGVFQEFKYRFIQTYNQIAEEYDCIREIWEKKGSPANNVNVMWWIADGGSSGEAANSDRIKMFALGSHLLHQFPSSYIRYDGENMNNVPLTGDWFNAMGADLGEPVGAKYSADGKAWRRDFTKGYVIVRYRLSESENFTDTGVYALPNPYRQVNADGTIGDEVTSVSLRNNEAFIGIL